MAGATSGVHSGVATGVQVCCEDGGAEGSGGAVSRACGINSKCVGTFGGGGGAAGGSGAAGVEAGAASQVGGAGTLVPNGTAGGTLVE